MTARIIAAALGLLLAAGSALAQADLPVGTPMPADTVRPAADTTAARAVAGTGQATDSLKVVKRTYSYRRQVALALAMMAFVAVMMTTAQSLNPE